MSTNGFGLPRYGQTTLAEQREQFRVYRDQLERSAVRVVEVYQWLRGQYVSNGELIAAALMAGYPMGRVDGPNTEGEPPVVAPGANPAGWCWAPCS